MAKRMADFILEDPLSKQTWKVKIDQGKGIMQIISHDNSHHWARKLGNSLPLDAFLVKDNVFLTWERPDHGYNRLQESSIISAHDLLSGELLWDWEDYVLTVLPYHHQVFIITYRDEFHKGFLINTESRQGKVLWKVATEAPIISWDINASRMILKDSLGRVFVLRTKDGKLKS